MPVNVQLARVAWLCLLALMPAPCWAENLRILLVLSDNGTPYQALAQHLKQNIPKTAQLIELNAIESRLKSDSQPDLVIAIGMKAMQSAIASKATAVLGVMITKQGYDSLNERHSKAISAIYLNQPYDRQLDFIQAILPSAKKVGMLYSPSMGAAMTDWKLASAARGISLNTQPVESPQALYQKLETVLESIDLLLAAPDSAIYNNNSIRNILLTSYQYKVPLIGISQAYVNAGALCAIFSSPEQLAEQTLKAVAHFDKTKQLPEPEYPVSFSVECNQQVARSLGIPTVSPETIRERMHKAEEGGR